MNNPIAISLSPNTDVKDIKDALKTILMPWKWKKGTHITEVEKWFSENYDAGISLSFNSGRSAIYAILMALGITEKDEVIIQAFTCVAVPDAVIWCKGKAVYADIDESLNLDPESLEKKITSRTKAVIVQHTFGVPAQMEAISRLAKRHHLFLIEDCAHGLGAEVDGRKVGTWGDAAAFSFGRDKIISSVFGGLAVIKSGHVREIEQLKKIHEKLEYPSSGWIFQQLLHPVLFSLILPLYSLTIGKILLFVSLKLHLLSKPVYKEEYKGSRPGIFPSRYPNALAGLLLYQLSKLGKMNDKRMKISNMYYGLLKDVKKLTIHKPVKGAVYLRYPVFSPKASDIIALAKKRKMLLGNWYHHVIDPKEAEYGYIGYKEGDCPNAEKASKQIINLPTYFRLKDADVLKVANLIAHYD